MEVVPSLGKRNKAIRSRYDNKHKRNTKEQRIPAQNVVYRGGIKWTLVKRRHVNVIKSRLGIALLLPTLMATENQLAIARQTRGASTHLSKTARKVVPRFLQKLYESVANTQLSTPLLIFVCRIVNDPETDDLIRWNEIGDSFYGAWFHLGKLA